VEGDEGERRKHFFNQYNNILFQGLILVFSPDAYSAGIQATGLRKEFQEAHGRRL